MNTVATPAPVSPIPLPVPVPAERTYGCTRLCVVEFGGADPAGQADATAAFQKAIDALPAEFGGEVHVPKGTYLIDPTISVHMRDNLWFHMDPEAVLVLKANDQPRYGGLAIKDVKNVLVSGGTVQGDRDHHTFADQPGTSKDTHEWGHAIQLYGSKQVTIRDIVLKDCTGDGISMGGTKQSGISDDIAVLNATITNNRRQGISIVSARNVVIQGGEISHINGTMPQCGIDIEPENGPDVVNVFIDRVHLHSNNANGILALQRGDVTTAVKGVQITNCLIEENKACGIYATHVADIDVFNNTIVRNGQTGFNIGPKCTGVHMAENTCGFNYNRGGPGLDRKDITVFGPPPKGREADILIRNDPAENQIGRNYFT